MRALILMVFAFVSAATYVATSDDIWFLTVHIYLAAYIALPLSTSKQETAA